ncbi:hypothetical protein [Sulfurimonas sp.]|uniref:hypothetical protein n=1 Tax=Sulfurimonas sp. TaxID=2022749 RepID=UPI002AB0DCAF|nr:hypothetical protein [Sulfurimonas sp.]
MKILDLKLDKELEDKFIKLLEANIKSEEQFRAEELHKVVLSAFIENNAELDKRLLSLSVGSIGFLLAFLINDYSFKNDFFYGFTFLAFLLAVSGFSYTIYLLLEILKLNTDYYKSIISFNIKGNVEQNKLELKLSLLDTKMKKFDKCAKKIFFISILISAFFIVMITANKNILEYKKDSVINTPNKENNMSNKKTEDTISITDNLSYGIESASGLVPASKVTKTVTVNKATKSKQDSNNSNKKGS